ncbi:MAG: Fic family protein [Solirubrobacteraceae bacterium]
MIAAAAVLAHGIAQAQAFRDGNRRTAYFAVQAFLERHGLGYLSGEDDDMLARKLNQVVERQSLRAAGAPPGPEDFKDLLRRRLEKRKPRR